MIECSLEMYPAAAKLFRETPFGALAAGTLEGGHPGRVFINAMEQPEAALLCTRVGYYFVAGQANARGFTDWLPRVFVEDLIPGQIGRIEEPECLLFYPDETWQAPLSDSLSGFDCRHLHKLRMMLEPVSAIAEPGPLSDGFSVHAYDAEIIQRHPGLSGEISLFFGSVEAFLERSMGFAVQNNAGTIASYCHAVFIGAGEAEISVATLPEFRRKGFARQVALNLLMACRSRDLEPVWGCFPENTPSVHLARSLGFIDQVRQPFYLFQQRNGGFPSEIPSTNTATA